MSWSLSKQNSYTAYNADKTTSFHNETTLSKLKRGDLIEFKRGMYSHWAVYIGEGKVVHLAGEDNDGLDGKIQPEHLFTISGKTFNKARVCIDELATVILGSKIYINNGNDKKMSHLHPEEIVQNAISRVGEVGYSVITKNCEHFAKWCRYGIEKSDQVESFLTGAAVGVAVGATMGLVYAVGKYWNTGPQSQHGKEEDD